MDLPLEARPLELPDWRADVLKFWFGLKPEHWWNGGAELDHRIKQDFLKLWTEKRQLPVDEFQTDPLTALAAVILFDQFPRNMFRGMPNSLRPTTLRSPSRRRRSRMASTRS